MIFRRFFVAKINWLPRMDSNHDSGFQRPLSCHWTTRQRKKSEIILQPQKFFVNDLVTRRDRHYKTMRDIEILWRRTLAPFNLFVKNFYP